MAETKTLKEKNAWLIRAAMIAHAIAFAWVALEPAKLVTLDPVHLTSRLEVMAVPGSASLGVIVIASLILLGLIPPNWRDRLIHLRWHHPLPGSRAFTTVGPTSSHVDMAVLTSKFGVLPSDPGEQNRLFYRIYKPLRSDISVCDPHGHYLAARDIGTITALLIVPLPLLAVTINHNVASSSIYAVGLLVGYLLCAVSAKNYGWRMVQHVLALTAVIDPVQPPPSTADPLVRPGPAI